MRVLIRHANYNAALELLGVGQFHWALLAICGATSASDAVEILAVSFLLPESEKDLDLTDHQKGVLSAVIFLGMMFGGALKTASLDDAITTIVAGWMWGSLSDRVGRTRCLVTSLMVNGSVLNNSGLTVLSFLLLSSQSGRHCVCSRAELRHHSDCSFHCRSRVRAAVLRRHCSACSSSFVQSGRQYSCRLHVFRRVLAEICAWRIHGLFGDELACRLHLHCWTGLLSPASSCLSFER